MRQALLVEPKKFQVRDVVRPAPSRDEVLIAVETAGICGSDMHTYHGANPVIRLPVVLGHECAGRIVEGGADQGLTPGTVVAVEPDAPCGECAYCQAGQTHLCDNMRFVGGLTYDGAFGEYIVAPAQGVVPLPDHVSVDEGAFGEPVAVAVHALGRVQSLPHDNMLILGAGTIGLLVAQVAAAYGAKKLAITDVMDKKLHLARELGIEHAINPTRVGVAEWARKYFGPTGPDVTFDCVGTTETVNQALQLTRKGGQIVLIGVTEGDLLIKPMELLLGERNLLGCYIYVRQDFLEAIRLIASGRVKVRPLVSARFPLEDIDQAFAFVADRANEAVKVLVKPGMGANH